MGNVSSQPGKTGNYVGAAALAAAAAGQIDSTASTAGIELSPGAATAASADAAATTDTAGTAAAIQSCSPAGRNRQRLQQLEAKLQCCMDREDRRVKELTEGVLYGLLPAALNVMLPNSEDPLQELDAQRCRAVGCAALAASSLMNAPPGFLEFLLCIPWCQLPLMYPATKNSDYEPEELLSRLSVDEQERRLLINMRIHPRLIAPVLEFLYKPENADSVPPVLRPAALDTFRQQQQVHQPQGKQQTAAPGTATAATAAASKAAGSAGLQKSCAIDTELLEVAAAVLDGATPLHCAALRGNPAQVDHLLYCGADPALRTASGVLALHLVPICGGLSKATGQRQCDCLGPADQEVWECRSRTARNLLARRCLWAFHVGVLPYLPLVWLCLMALLGFILPTSLTFKLALQEHLQKRQETQARAAQARAAALIDSMRHEAKEGHSHLSTAKRRAGYRQHKAEPPDDNSDSQGASVSSTQNAAAGRATCSLSARHARHDAGSTEQLADAARKPDTKATISTQQLNSDSRMGKAAAVTDESAALTAVTAAAAAANCGFNLANEHGRPAPQTGQDQPSELAFKCFVRAVHALQSLNLQGGTTPQVAATAAATSARSAGAVPGLTLDGTNSSTMAGIGSNNSFDPFLDIVDQQPLLVLEDEQAEVYCCWAESVLLKMLACRCPGCMALATQAIRMAHVAIACLFGRMQKLRQQYPQRWQTVGQAFSRVVHAHIALLWYSEAEVSPSRTSVWRVLHCLHEWDKLVAAGLAQVDNSTAGLHMHWVEALRSWAKTAESDLLIAEALLGSSLNPFTTLAEALAAALVAPHKPIPLYSSSISNGNSSATLSTQAAVAGLAQPAGSSSSSCLPILARPTSQALLEQLQAARGLAICPSPAIKQLAAQVAEATAAELSAGAKLRKVLATRTPPSTQGDVTALADAIAVAASYSSLAADVEAATALYQQCCQRTEAAARLQAVVKQVLEQTSLALSKSASAPFAASAFAGAQGAEEAGSPSPLVAGFSTADWQQHIALLEAAVEEAKDANVNVIKARKLAKELQAQMAAIEAAAQLDACLAPRPCGSGVLKAAISKGEGAAAAISGTMTAVSAAGAVASTATGLNRNSCSNCSASGVDSNSSSATGGGSTGVFSEVLQQRLQAAKKRLEVERACEVLHKSVLTHRAVADLPRLEAAILNARKVGAEELAPEEYRAASELRARLTAAARVRQALDAALRSLTAAPAPGCNSSRQVDELVALAEAAIRDAERWEDLLPGEAARAAEAISAWRTSSACEAKLARAMRDGTSSTQLSRLVTEAAAAGVKVAAARRILKLQQMVEAAMAAADDATGTSSVQYSQLAAKLEVADIGGVAQSVLKPARQLLAKMQAADAKIALEAALKPRSDWSANMRMAALKAALDKAEEVVGNPITYLANQQQQQAGKQQQSQSLANVQQFLQAECAQQQQSNGQRLYHYPDSTVSSSAANDAAADGDGCKVTAAVRNLAVRAWQLLESDQQQLDRERAEHEKAKRELRERERQERQRAEAERVGKGRAERNKAAAERKQARFRPIAERGRSLSVLFGTANGDAAGSSNASSTASSAGNLAKMDKGNDSNCIANDGNNNVAASAAEGAVVLQAYNAATAVDSQPSTDSSQPNAVFAEPSQHMRSGSYDLMGDASSRIGQDVLALLDLPETHHSTAGTAAAEPQLLQLQQAVPKFELSASAGEGIEQSSRMDAAPQDEQQSAATAHTAAAAMQLSVDAVAMSNECSQASGSASRPATPRFSYADLGGASWGVDNAGSLSKLSEPSPVLFSVRSALPALAMTGAGLAAVDQAAGHSNLMSRHESAPILTDSMVALSTNAVAPLVSEGIWGSALGLHANSAFSPPALPRGQAGRSHRNTTINGVRGIGGQDAVQLSRQLLQQGMLHINNAQGSAAASQGLPGLPEQLVSGAAMQQVSAGAQQPVLLTNTIADRHALRQLQQHELAASAMLQHQGPSSLGSGVQAYTGYCAAAGDLALLAQSAARPASNASGHASAPLGSSAHPSPTIMAAAAAAAVAAAAAMSVLGPAAGNQKAGAGLPYSAHLHSSPGSTPSQLSYLQAQQQQQLQQHHPLHTGAQASLLLGQQRAASTDGLLGAGGAAVTAAMSSQDIGAFSNSFAFGAPGLSAFSRGYTPVGCHSTSPAHSTTGCISIAGTEAFTSSSGQAGSWPSPSADGAVDACGMAVSAAPSGSTEGLHSPTVCDAVSRLPDDLNFSPPTPSPADRLRQ